MATPDSEALPDLLKRVRTCRICEAVLPLGPRPVLRADARCRILIVGQAPGTRVHQTGVPWNDPSGDQLRQWTGLDRDTFYDGRKIAIIPMGFCYPGKGKSGDLPPRKECAETWHRSLLAKLPRLELTLLVGQYAQAYYLSDFGPTLADTVRRWRRYGPGFLPMPHPSPRNRRWLKNNPWFEEQVVPELRTRIQHILG